MPCGEQRRVGHRTSACSGQCKPSAMASLVCGATCVAGAPASRLQLLKREKVASSPLPIQNSLHLPPDRRSWALFNGPRGEPGEIARTQSLVGGAAREGVLANAKDGVVVLAQVHVLAVVTPRKRLALGSHGRERRMGGGKTKEHISMCLAHDTSPPLAEHRYKVKVLTLTCAVSLQPSPSPPCCDSGSGLRPQSSRHQWCPA